MAAGKKWYCKSGHSIPAFERIKPHDSKWLVAPKPFLKKNQRNYIYAATDRFDEFTDTRRSVQSKGYKLIYNCDTTSPVFRRVKYRQQMKTMRLLDSLKESQQLSTYFTNWFSKNKNRFELYEVSEDYYETNNLMSYPRYERVFKTLRKELFTCCLLYTSPSPRDS